ncbi:uncharacterized protein [Notamacropus eugenii]|uniref:uncharacterized protein n=1 Tax=Notamacropus eugenii TaxID=9315 RepID=UPI003B6814F7
MSYRRDPSYEWRISLSVSTSMSPQRSEKSTASRRGSSTSKEKSKYSGVKSQSRSKSKSRSQSSPPRPYRVLSLSSTSSFLGNRFFRGCHPDSRFRLRSRSRTHSRTRTATRIRTCTRTRSHSRPRPRHPPRPRTHRRSRSRSYGRNYQDYRDYGGHRNHSYTPPAPCRYRVGNRYRPEPNCCLGVFGLSLCTTERELREIFDRYGRVSEVTVIYDQLARRSRGFAFVYFQNVEDAIEAKEGADGVELHGHRIRVDFSITRRPHPRTPGIYMGRPTCRHIDCYDYRDWNYYVRLYGRRGARAAVESRGGWRNDEDRDRVYRRRSSSPRYRQRTYYRSRSRSPLGSRSRPCSRRF